MSRKLRAHGAIDVGPATQDLQCGTVGKAQHYPSLTAAQQLELLCFERMVATDDR
jgi:hypothetical protein